MNSTVASVPTWKKWVIAIRPFALPASVVPVCFGTVAAGVLGSAPFHPFLFLIALLAMALLHSSANMLSDVSDFRRGLDRESTPVSGAIIRGLLSPETVFRGAWVLLAIGAALGLVLVRATGPGLLILGAGGIGIGLLYSPMKARALGDLAVLMNFGVLGSLGAWMVQTRSAHWAPVVWAVPIGFHVIGILHANNWRDADSDRTARVRTLAAHLGDRGSSAYFTLMIASPFLLVTGFVCPVLSGLLRLPPLPITVLLVWLSLPLALSVLGRARRRASPVNPMDFIALDGAVARLSLVFGILYVLGVWAGRWTGTVAG